MSCKGVIDSLFGSMDAILGIRDDIGAVLKPVFILTRVWTGSRVGDGTASDTYEQILPSPLVKQYASDLRLVEGGMVKQGDNLVTGISKGRYPLESDIDCTTSNPLIEKFYMLGDKIYTIVNVNERYVTWDVLLRERSDQTKYSGV